MTYGEFEIDLTVRPSWGGGIRVKGGGRGISSRAVESIVNAQINAVSGRNVSKILIYHTDAQPGVLPPDFDRSALSVPFEVIGEDPRLIDNYLTRRRNIPYIP